MRNSLDNNLLNVNNKKKLTKQWAVSSSASIMIFQKKNTSLEGRHLVVTLLASILLIGLILLYYSYITYNTYKYTNNTLI